MTPWTIAAVQTDPRLGDAAGNLARLRAELHAAADGGANLVAFPECALPGYGFADRGEAERAGEAADGPTAAAVAADCAARGVWCVYGFLESSGGKLYNAAAVVGPRGLLGVYRKTHLPCVGADRFTDPGDGPLAVFDLGGLRVGVGICFDGGFPEVPRVLALLGADLILLPTNWAGKAHATADLVPRTRALENHLFFAAINRVGEEAGYSYIGKSSICGPGGTVLAAADHARECTLFAAVDPAAARQKRVVHCPGEYEVDRVGWRRPHLYGPLLDPPFPAFPGHHHPPKG